MKTKTFRYGKYTLKSYLKKAGKGYETGFTFAGKPLFVGNFIHSREANAWYTMMNREVTSFTKKYWATPDAPTTFYKSFFANHLYKTYYAYLDKCFAKYNREYNTEFTKYERKYTKMKKHWEPTEQFPFSTAA